MRIHVRVCNCFLPRFFGDRLPSSLACWPFLPPPRGGGRLTTCVCMRACILLFGVDRATRLTSGKTSVSERLRPIICFLNKYYMYLSRVCVFVRLCEQFEGPLLDLYLHYCSVGLGSPSAGVRAASIGMLGPLLLRSSESMGDFLATMLRMAGEVGIYI